MKTRPIVTVIVTVYNRTEYIKLALQSVLNQSYWPIDIIVADDSTNDAIKNIVYSFNNPTIRYKGNSSRLGVARNIVEAVDWSLGNYISILNDDDVWEPEFLFELVNALESNSDRVLAFCDHWIISEDGGVHLQKTEDNTKLYGRDTLLEGDLDNPIKFVLRKNGIPLAMGSVIRKDAIDWTLVVDEVSGAYDYWISCLIALSNKPIYYCPKRLTRYRVHPMMETARKGIDKNLNLVYIFRNLMQRESLASERNFILGEYTQALNQVGKDHLYFDSRDSARIYFVKALQLKITLKGFIFYGLSYLPRWFLFGLK